MLCARKIQTYAFDLNMITQRFLASYKMLHCMNSNHQIKGVAYKMKFGFSLVFSSRHPPHLLLVKPEPNTESGMQRKRAKNTNHGNLHRLKDKEIKGLQTKLVQMFVAHHFSALERCLFGEKIELAPRITHPCPSPHYIRSKTTNNSSSCI